MIGRLGAAFAIAAALMATGCGAKSSSDTTSTSGAFNPQKDGELAELPDIVSKDGVLKTTLKVQDEDVQIAGRQVKAVAYNGVWPGPTMHVKPGDTMQIELVNDLSQETNLHTHGFHVSPAGISDNVLRTIGPGESAPIRIHIPKDIATGTYWYHAHLHGLTEPQVFGGMSGILIVDGLEQKLPPDLRDIKQHVLAIKDLQVKNGAIVTSNIDSDAPTTRTVNGQVEPRISIRPGETQLWRIANISADIWYHVQLPGTKFNIVAEDANPVWKVVAKDRLLMPPGKRYDVLVQGPPVGEHQLKTLKMNTGPAGDNYPEVKLASVVSGGDAVQPAAIPDSVIPKSSLAAQPVTQHRQLTFSENTKTNQFYINGVQFNASKVNETARLGDLQEWTIKNTSSEMHPFHVHVNDFQVVSVNGKPYRANGLQDIVPLPVKGEAVIRMKFTDFTGQTVFHCHILAHEDNGMMGILQINPRNGELPKSELATEQHHSMKM